MMPHRSPAHRTSLLTRLAMALAAGAWLAAGVASAAPEPSVTDQSWRLDFTYQTPDAVLVEQADGDPQWYWYLPYKITNNTEKKRLFVPDFTIMDNTGRVVQAGHDVSPRAFKKIKKKLNNPLLRSPASVAGMVLTGEDHAKESVAIWPASNKNVDSFRVFVGGLSGESVTIRKSGSEERVTLYRTLMLRYKTPGNFKTPEHQTVKFDTEDWVMR